MSTPQPSKPSIPFKQSTLCVVWAVATLLGSRPLMAEPIQFSGGNQTGIRLRQVTHYQSFEFPTLPGLLTGRVDPLAESPYAYVPPLPQPAEDLSPDEENPLKDPRDLRRKETWPGRENPFETLLKRQLEPRDWLKEENRETSRESGDSDRDKRDSRQDRPGTSGFNASDSANSLTGNSGTTNRITFSTREGSPSTTTNRFQVNLSPESGSESRMPLPGALDRTWFNPYQQDRMGADGALIDAQRRFMKARGLAVPEGSGLLRGPGASGRGPWGGTGAWLPGISSSGMPDASNGNGLPGLALPSPTERSATPNLSAPRRTDPEESRTRITTDRKPAELRIPQRPF